MKEKVSKNYTKGFSEKQIRQINIFYMMFELWGVEDCEYMIDQYHQMKDSEMDCNFIEWMQNQAEVQKQILAQNKEVAKMFKNQVNK